jgi:GT2 family glycosyltransferase
MPEPAVSVAIPVRDGGAVLGRVLRALARQTVAHELLVCDSGSRDGSAQLARSHGARVIEIAPGEFGHGRTRNLLMRETNGDHVALLTQDAEPAGEFWLERLLGAFELADDVGLAFGPYIARPGAAPAVRGELERWFASLPPGLERADRDERLAPAAHWMGARGFFTDANSCLSRAAWQRVPYRDVPIAEDRVLAVDMLRAGYAKAYVPGAAVLHSHHYSTPQQLRRTFDEWRGLREIYGWREPLAPAHLLAQIRGALGEERRALDVAGVRGGARLRALTAAATHRSVRLAGGILGSRADLLPPSVRRTLSLERRASFTPLELDTTADPPRPS